VLAVPDVLVTAVGTVVHWRGPGGHGWEKDMEYDKSLDEGWDLVAARRAVQSMLDAHKAENPEEPGVHWLDDGSEHRHRTSVSVRVDKLARIEKELTASFGAEGVRFKLIVSGCGDWRYVDCVAANGGKLAALEYVRKRFGIPASRVLAAGDSGNDTLMLGEGKNLGVCVANSQPDLIHWLAQRPQDGRVLLADRPLAAGIIEGLMRFGLY